MTVEAAIERQLAGAIDLRHRLHRIPELQFEEHRTAATIRAELDALGLDHIDGVLGAPTATLALLGDRNKSCVALRADIDALPIQENTGLPYASENPSKMHACGHDGHTATLLGAAAILKRMEKQLPACVKLIWQPAEEQGGGAQRLVQAGVLDGRVGPKVAAVFGLHGWPGLAVGMIASKSGPILAATDNFRITFIGSGGHAAYPQKGIDPVVPAASAVLDLQQVVSRDMDPTEPAVVTVALIRAGEAVNVIPGSATLEGTARTLGSAARSKVRQHIERRCAGIAAAGRCQVQFEWFEGYPATVNDPVMTDYTAKIAQRIFGARSYVPLDRPSMAGEDFAYYLEKVPGCFFFIGVDHPGGRANAMLHSDRYDFADDAVAVGMRMFTEIVLNFASRELASPSAILLMRA
jgi:amidohydrolase